MRIAFTGAHRVEKTTLTEAIADSFPDYGLKQEPYFQLEETQKIADYLIHKN